jgi:2,3-bisphosphoglycerate-independent phosphoglycerate mutase
MSTPVTLVILDGWGYSPSTEHNAIANATTPVWDQLLDQHPHTFVECAGPSVGLPEGQMGNSEVGHMHMGAGRLVPQDLLRIDHALEDGSFATNPTIEQGLQKARNSALHIFGLLSPGGVHSRAAHLHHLIELAQLQDIPHIYLHAFLDGRDTPPQSALDALNTAAACFDNHPTHRIATLVGRYYAMDRDQRWERTQHAYQLLCDGKAAYTATDHHDALQAAYQRGENDEFVQATVIGEPVPIHADDVVVFMNFRADRARQLTRAFVDPDFSAFPRRFVQTHFISLTTYADDLPTQVAFPFQAPRNGLGEVLAQHHRTQLRLAETEKYAHVTFFFNGGIEVPNAGEDRCLIPSAKVATYDLKPDMSAVEITNALIQAWTDKQYDVIVVNYANADMVGHTGNFAATQQAIECLDACLGRLLEAQSRLGGEMLITADHGNAEKMFNPATQQAHTAHTCNVVPLVYVGRAAWLAPQGSLLDIAPTMLHLLGLTPPDEMTGQNLITLQTRR